MDITSCEKTPLLEAHWLWRVFEGYGLEPVFAGYGLGVFFEGYEQSRRSEHPPRREHRPVHNSLKTDPALAAEGNDPDVYPGPGPDPGQDPDPVPLPPPDPDPGLPLDPLPTPAPVY
jgi:hypothetical protein